MPKIYTMYNRAQRVNENKIYDTHDDVDRLSYVDNAQLIKRFIQEGKNLAVARAQALKAGMYSGDLKEIYSDDEGLAMPVYESDPVVTQPIIEAASSAISAKKKAVHEAMSANKSNDSDVPNPTADSSGASAPGAATQQK